MIGRGILGLTMLIAMHGATGCAATARPRPDWAIAIHGGAGVISKDTPEEERQAYEQSLTRALNAGRAILEAGGTSLDAVTAVVTDLEDDPRFNAGKGAVFTNAGTCELDASIMDGSDLNCGAVSGVTHIKHPILLARRVMTGSRHVFLVGAGAESFAREQGLEFVDNAYFQTPHRRESWERAVEREREGDQSRAPIPDAWRMGTVGAVALDRSGNLAAATSTGGLTNKRWGRVGDSPIIGAGTFAANDSCAVSCTGTGELFIRRGVAREMRSLVHYAGLDLEAAATEIIHRRLSPGDGGLIAVGRDGQIALVFNTDGMFRGAADSTGRFEVRIWE